MLINNVRITNKEIAKFDKELLEHSKEIAKISDDYYQVKNYSIESILDENLLLVIRVNNNGYEHKIGTITNDLKVKCSNDVYGYEQSVIYKLKNYILNKPVEYRPKMPLVDSSLMCNLVHSMRDWFGRYYAIDLDGEQTLTSFQIVRLEYTSLIGKPVDVDVATVSNDGDITINVDKNDMVSDGSYTEIDFIMDYIHKHKHESKINRYAHLEYQTGTEKEHGINGLQVNDIIEIAKNRLNELNDQKPCKENKMTMTLLKLAQGMQDQRDDRIANGEDEDVEKSMIIGGQKIVL
ncbi:hypothetical protein DY120_07300 [Apilactobacillus micheneri]|uniref:Uncharacterized protein n=1 Tax=Apilactobacillus micheneri TaxID=1899430 RepID=A0ABY2YVZ2_9LACO|nr:hypothetical protein [Apilactobacillus micheneri]TPR23104.1 hypothetical protein DY114_07285 [Apilactobacillus micheneri]TPR24422.1 hypothetical protein DY111_07300 [Apilactobacillus micheneri]TPR29369.1 hypothetical protein DY120_07300 [Apilactobacillus micheneri]TPR34576.1 hypothetical protein DY027_07290 [Apilactobacillus micheneri]